MVYVHLHEMSFYTQWIIRIYKGVQNFAPELLKCALIVLYIQLDGALWVL